MRLSSIHSSVSARSDIAPVFSASTLLPSLLLLTQDWKREGGTQGEIAPEHVAHVEQLPYLAQLQQLQQPGGHVTRRAALVLHSPRRPRLEARPASAPIPVRVGPDRDSGPS